MDDDAGAEEADAGQDSLNDAASGVWKFVIKRGRQYHDCCGSEAYQPEGPQPDRFAVQIAVKADGAAGERRSAQTQQDVRPVEQCDDPLKTPYFGRRPII